MKYEVDINELSKSELYDLLVIRDNKITELLNAIKEIKELANKPEFTMQQKYEMRESILDILDKVEENR